MNIKSFFFSLLVMALPLFANAVEIDDEGFFTVTIGEVECTFRVIDAEAMTCRLDGDFDPAVVGTGSLVLPAEVEGYRIVELSAYAFENCELSEVDLSNLSITEIPVDCFSYAEQLSKVVLPETIKKIGRSAFNNCTRLASVNMPEGIESIGDYAFKSVGTENTYQVPSDWDDWYDDVPYPFDIYIPSAVATIGKDAFNDVPLGTVTCNIRNPFEVGSGVFSNKGDAKLIVHTGLSFKFESTSGWEFGTIEEQDLGDAIDISTPLVDILSNGVDGESYQVREELTVAAQWSVKKVVSGMVTTTTHTYYMLLTDNGGHYIRLVIPEANYKDLDDVYTIAEKSITGILHDRDNNPYIEVSSIPVEGDGDDEYELRQWDVNTPIDVIPNEPIATRVYYGLDGKYYADQSMSGSAYSFDLTYADGFFPVKGTTYDVNLWTAVNGNTVTRYAYLMTEVEDIEKVEYSTPLTEILSGGVEDQQYIVREQLYVTHVFETSVTTGSGFLVQTRKFKNAICTDGNGNWINVRYEFINTPNPFGGTNYTMSIPSTTLHAQSVDNAVLKFENGNPCLIMPTGSVPVEGDNIAFDGFRTYDLNEHVDIKPYEVFYARGYVVGDEDNLSLSANADGSGQCFASKTEVEPNVNQDLQYFLYPGYHYDVKAYSMLSEAWTESNPSDGNDYYQNYNFSVLKNTYVFDDQMIVFKSNDENGSQWTITDKNSAAQNKYREEFYNEIIQGREHVTFVTCSRVSSGYQGLKFLKNGTMELTLDRPYQATAVRVVACKLSEHNNYNGTAIAVDGSTVASADLHSRKFEEYTFPMPEGTELEKVKITANQTCYVIALSIDEGSSLDGDVNGDGTVDVADVNAAINVVLGVTLLEDYPNADINGDGNVDVTDVNQIISIVLGK